MNSRLFIRCCLLADPGGLAPCMPPSLSAATLPQELERVKKDFPVITKAETTEQTMKAANTVALVRHVTFPSRWYQLFQLE